ncbi:MAG: 3-deoxy-8-phosphooctulonate synthase [Alphaproteobacteria bacterium CG_4_10_14_0_2_um_filter_63_37]|nr:MAG: 3-deoxy-8-phosphooctulonate synthase [Proteobacteria bacterium CG1_02_64_396]PJA25971.1 MAG: 3-deoxy-8-phosphooctulonate synthase [Alphaproteobacteria bacterium CG_4_10_14_0_2_um_filter_63_37]
MKPLILIAGPCVIETLDLALSTAETLKGIAERLGLDFYYKSSFDKANRTSASSFRGPGREEGLRILERVKSEFGLRVLSDVHDLGDVTAAAGTLDVLQIPAFLCRQTDLVQAAVATGKTVNIKKGQFMAPWDMKPVVGKARAVAGAGDLWLTERGTTFGYNNLVVDFRSFAEMSALGCPTIMDATHSVQLPGGQGSCSGGQREFVPTMVKAAMAVGADGLFMETHPNPDQALCDGPNSWPLDQMQGLLETALRIREAAIQ